MKTTIKTLSTLGLLLSLTACMPAEFKMYEEKVKAANNGLGDPDDPPAVCDPFDTSNNVSAISGLKGSIHYLKDGQPRSNSSTDLINTGTQLKADLFLSSLYVPTRIFNSGFVPDGAPGLVNESNQLLIEWFALNLKSKLKLGSADRDGLYQLAVLSDDGATLSLQDQNGVFQKLIDNEGTHPTRMACASKVIDMNAASRIPMNLSYFQGPREHISLILMWRKVDPNASLSDSQCGKEGNDYFFNVGNATTPAVMKSPYQQLLSRGWKPLSAENFELQEGYNRCNVSR
ncbi:MAG TPA: hypothetical protein VM432_03190 [Bdellovibrionales bacterium]|nr:hypothetical protein [Bdellovibrionales bacterium]